MAEERAFVVREEGEGCVAFTYRGCVLVGGIGTDGYVGVDG